MRKIAFVLTVLLAATAPAFSQVRLASWGRLVWLPYFIDQGDKPRSLIEAPWGDEPDMEFMITAANANFGIDVGLLIEKGSLERGNVSQIANMKAWWSPNRYFKLHIGSGRVSPMRGQIYGSTGMYAYARGQLTGLTARSGDNEPIVKIDDGDGIFSRINLGRLGAIAELTPLPGLYIAAAVMPEYNGDKGNFAQDVYKGVQAVAGYTFGGIGLARI
ncbi:MAG: hypothetical protein FWF29_13415, partial [Treponema sp.]|nr:hypothetical protein [Treponema sp.]